jgi:hypothetical protein
LSGAYPPAAILPAHSATDVMRQCVGGLVVRPVAAILAALAVLAASLARAGRAGPCARLAAALALAALAACASRPDQANVSVGIDFPQPHPASDYAALYAPYAMMAALAYADEAALAGPNHCPDAAGLARQRPGASGEDLAFNARLGIWLADLAHRGWECRFGLVRRLSCPRRLGTECRPVEGLQFHVWWRMQGGACREVAIAFRGTDRNDAGDWLSNFRFLHRLTPRFDQYDQVRTHIRRIVARIKANGCGGSDVLFVAVGHSLGGGLAQQAAYADGAIRYVYAFDSSPITGLFDISAIVLARNTRGLGVDRAYEAGEILTLPRVLIENIIPPLPCNPRIRTVRFNLLEGSPVAQHNIADLTARLRDAAQTAGADPTRVAALREARGCAAPELMQLLLAPP